MDIRDPLSSDVFSYLNLSRIHRSAQLRGHNARVALFPPPPSLYFLQCEPQESRCASLDLQTRWFKHRANLNGLSVSPKQGSISFPYTP